MHPNTHPQTDDPHRTTPQRSLSHHRHRRRHRHTHTLVCVCVWLWQQQRAAAGESPTRSFGVCTANQTHTARNNTRLDHH